MKKHFSSLLAAAFLLSGCSWLSALNPWAEEKPAAETPGDYSIWARAPAPAAD